MMLQRQFASKEDSLDFTGMMASASWDNVIGFSTALIERGSADREVLAFAYTRRAAARFRKSQDEAIRDYEKALELSTEGAGYIHAEMAVRLFKRDRDRAMQHFAQSIALNTQDPYPYFQRAQSQMDAGELDLAVRDFDRVIELAPNRASAYVRRADAHRALGDLQRALSDYMSALGVADRQFVKNAQSALREEGFYRGQDDGLINEALRDAVAGCVRTPACKSVVRYWSWDTRGDRP
jgi:tetratricopeptide (TPR) repeat protein